MPSLGSPQDGLDTVCQSSQPGYYCHVSLVSLLVPGHPPSSSRFPLGPCHHQASRGGTSFSPKTSVPPTPPLLVGEREALLGEPVRRHLRWPHEGTGPRPGVPKDSRTATSVLNYILLPGEQAWLFRVLGPNSISGVRFPHTKKQFSDSSRASEHSAPSRRRVGETASG